MLNSLVAGVRIEAGQTPANLDNPTASGVLWQARRGEFLIDVPGAARYLVTGGDKVVFEKKPEAPPERAARFLGVAPLAALLYQRGVFACHAAGVATAKGAVLIAGNSGAGKSTLAAALVDRGCRLLADDIAAVEVNAAGWPTVRATESRIVLWPDAVAQIFPRGLPGWWERDPEPTPAVPLCAIFLLSAGSRIDCEEGTQPAARFELATRMVWNSRIADALLDRGMQLNAVGAIARQVPMKRLFRSKVRYEAGALADSIMEQWG
jgi:hypothetical protein